ncbi:MAG: VOC family protein [Oscillospiraceae bacterium]|jgi:catechol 2,3-dioxygenase-like lactoylglutathione lyase family enzyme|nr:VOC family protein [Oscillospiraceae bacterium]
MVKSIIGITFDCRNANELADFYVKLLGLEKTISTDEWAAIHTPQGIMLVFQTVENYERPVWPWTAGKQQQMAHIDFFVENLDVSVEQAITYGAKKADIQYHNDSTVMLDPAGHPFCLSTVQQ